jgi:hypothetical protein
MRIIKKEDILDYSEKHFIAVDEPNCCWLIRGTKVSNSEEGAQKLKKIEKHTVIQDTSNLGCDLLI